jgi:hypothetical protein
MRRGTQSVHGLHGAKPLGVGELPPFFVDNFVSKPVQRRFFQENQPESLDRLKIRQVENQ